MDNSSNISLLIKHLPDCEYAPLSMDRRTSYIEKLAKNCEANLYHILKLINTTPTDGNSVLKMFSSLNSKQNICKALYKKSGWNDKNKYIDLVRTFTLLFYKNILKENIREQVIRNHLFKWYKAPDFNIFYSTSLIATRQIEFSADIEYLLENDNDKERVKYEKPISIPTFSVVGVDFKTKVDFIGVEGQIFPMPAFYFNWMVHEYNRLERVKAINVAFYTASLCFGIGEISTAQKAWKAAVALVGIVHSSGKLYFQFNDNAKKRLALSEEGEIFLTAWNLIGNAITGNEITTKLIDSKFPLFVALNMAWNNISVHEKIELKKLMTNDEYNDLITIINTIK